MVVAYLFVVWVVSLLFVAGLLFNSVVDYVCFTVLICLGAGLNLRVCCGLLMVVTLTVALVVFGFRRLTLQVCCFVSDGCFGCWFASLLVDFVELFYFV